MPCLRVAPPEAMPAAKPLVLHQPLCLRHLCTALHPCHPPILRQIWTGIASESTAECSASHYSITFYVVMVFNLAKALVCHSLHCRAICIRPYFMHDSGSTAQEYRILCRFVPEASTSAQAMDTLSPLPAAAVVDGDMRQDEEGNLRLGLRMEQRGNVKRLVRTLKQRLDRASSDLQVCLLLACVSGIIAHVAVLKDTRAEC